LAFPVFKHFPRWQRLWLFGGFLGQGFYRLGGLWSASVLVGYNFWLFGSFSSQYFPQLGCFRFMGWVGAHKALCFREFRPFLAVKERNLCHNQGKRTFQS
jgi:hypothetical protein